MINKCHYELNILTNNSEYFVKNFLEFKKISPIKPHFQKRVLMAY